MQRRWPRHTLISDSLVSSVESEDVRDPKRVEDPRFQILRLRDESANSFVLSTVSRHDSNSHDLRSLIALPRGLLVCGASMNDSAAFLR